jgi:hypothetical protein
MSNNTYWNSNGKHQAAYQELCKIVPSSGPAGTVEGEMLRAVTRIYYDYYNNGMINNTSGAVNYLMHCDELLFGLDLCEELAAIEPECNTGHYTNASLAYPLEIIADTVIEYAINKNGVYTESSDNMFDYADPDVTFEDDDYTEEDMWEEETMWETDDVLADCEYDELRFQD